LIEKRLGLIENFIAQSENLEEQRALRDSSAADPPWQQP
jgi:hypothetical protein